MGPGNIAWTTPAEAMDAKICDMNTSPARTHPTAPINAMPNVTAGLNSPPETRKKTHALTARLKPKANEMYRSVLALGTCDRPPSDDPDPAAAALATWVAENAKKRNRKVPTNLVRGCG